MISIIKDYLHHQTTNVVLDNQLLQLAKAHEVEAIIYKQTYDSRLKSKYFFCIYSYQNRLKIVKEISALLQQYDIPFFFVKGIEVAKYYPDPYLKTMGDCDLVVHKEDKKKVADLLVLNGYQEGGIERERDSEWHFYKNGMLIELHHALLYGREAFEVVNDDFLEYVSQCWNYVCDDKLNDSYHLIYLLLHLRKHFMNKGIGIRQFLDIACFSNADINWNYVEEELVNIGLLKFANTVYGLIYEWWDLKYPLTIKVSETFCAQTTDELLGFGVFGYKNGNYENDVLNEVHFGRNIWRQKLEFIFPSYFYMCKSGNCPKLEGRPYLLPLYWVKRACHYRSDYKDKFSKFNVSKKKIDTKNKKLKDWGL